MVKKFALALFAAILTINVCNANSKTGKITVLISLDGFRWDYPQWYNTPFFDFLEKNGVAAALQPSFPSKTFPNHYTLATGLYPDHHGIVANSFLDTKSGKTFNLSNKETKCDARFYGGEPIWLTAQKQGLKTAVVYWPGSDVAVNGQYPDSYLRYDDKPRLPFQQRVNRVLDFLKLPEESRPDLIMAYFEDPDHQGHYFGPEGKTTGRAVVTMDSLMNVLYNGIKSLPISDKINFVIVSDHGMTPTSPQRGILVKPYLKQQWVRHIEGNLPALIYANNGCADSIVAALKDVPHLRVWKTADVPAYLHYGTNRMEGDVVALPDLGWIFTDSPVLPGGAHGYDPTYNDMHAVFRAIGPDFKSGYTKKPHVENVNIYPLISKLLGIIPAPNDGNIKEVEDLLVK